MHTVAAKTQPTKTPNQKNLGLSLKKLDLSSSSSKARLPKSSNRRRASNTAKNNMVTKALSQPKESTELLLVSLIKKKQ